MSLIHIIQLPCFRFMVDPLLSNGRRPGPASRTFYPEVIQSGSVNNSKEFREELSCAFSSTYLLYPHAIVRSYFDQKAIWCYKDPEAYNQASLYCPANTNPGDELRFSLRSVYQARVVYQLRNTLQ